MNYSRKDLVAHLPYYIRAAVSQLFERSAVYQRLGLGS